MTTIATTLGALAPAQEALAGLLKLRHAPKVAYHLARLMDHVLPEVQQFVAQRDALVREYGTERALTEAERAAQPFGPPTTWEISPASPQWDRFAARLAEVAQVPVTIRWAPIRLEDLDPATVQLTGEEVWKLRPLLAPESPEPAAS